MSSLRESECGESREDAGHNGCSLRTFVVLVTPEEGVKDGTQKDGSLAFEDFRVD